MKQLISLQEDFLANLTPLPGSAEGHLMTVSSGQNYSEWLQGLSVVGWWGKMLLESPIWNSTVSLLIWRESATPAGYLIFRLQELERSTDGIEFGYLPTLTTATSWQGEGTVQAYREAGFKQPTYRYNKQGRRVERTDYGSTGTFEVTLCAALMAIDGIKPGGTVHPEFAEWHMGYPVGWTDLGD